MLVSYLIPIILIVILGIISYRRAAGTIIANYEMSMENTIEKTAEYYGLMMNNIAGTCNQIAINNSLRSYYRGAYKDDPLQEKKNFRELNKSLLRDAFAGDYISGIYAFGEYGNPCVSYLDVKKLDYEEYSGTQEGLEMAGMKEQVVFAGYHRDLDGMTEHRSDEYAFTVKRNIVNQASRPVGVVVMDVAVNTVKEPLMRMDLRREYLCPCVRGRPADYQYGAGYFRGFFHIGGIS